MRRGLFNSTDSLLDYPLTDSCRAFIERDVEERWVSVEVVLVVDAPLAFIERDVEERWVRQSDGRRIYLLSANNRYGTYLRSGHS